MYVLHTRLCITHVISPNSHLIREYAFVAPTAWIAISVLHTYTLMLSRFLKNNKRAVHVRRDARVS